TLVVPVSADCTAVDNDTAKLPEIVSSASASDESAASAGSISRVSSSTSGSPAIVHHRTRTLRQDHEIRVVDEPAIGHPLRPFQFQLRRTPLIERQTRGFLNLLRRTVLPEDRRDLP